MGVDFFEKRSVVNPETGCREWSLYRDKAGYGRMNPKKFGEVFAHRSAWTSVHGPIPKGLKILHRCDVRCCVNEKHLFLGTQADNVKDCVQKGRARGAVRPGESNPMARLTNVAVQQMRELRAHSGLSYKKIAFQFGVSTMTAFRACTGRSWGACNA